jgi:acetolactate decarboxylase
MYRTVTRYLILTTILAACVAPYLEMQVDRDTLFQTSTLSALQAGDYVGILTIGALKQHGDFGLGTFNTLDGEMGF